MRCFIPVTPPQFNGSGNFLMTPSCYSRCSIVFLVLAILHHWHGICCGFQFLESRPTFGRECQRATRPTTATASLNSDLSGCSSRKIFEEGESNNKDDLNAFKFQVAPMQCYTNESLRQLYRALSSNVVLWTEMEKVPDLLCSDTTGMERRFGRPGHKDIVLQLGGNNPTSLQQCLTRLSDLGYSFDEINLNCGCPSIESGGGSTFGASLMKDPELTRQLLETMVQQNQSEQTQVSLKCRTAVVNDIEEIITRTTSDDNFGSEIYKSLHYYVSQAELAGISHLVLHARPAVLSGLSPVKNRQVPPLNYRLVEQIAQDFPSIRVTLNGGINSLSQLEELKRQHQQQGNGQSPMPRSSKISSYMAGRWMLRRPLDLTKIHCDHSSSRSAGDGYDTHDPVSAAAARKAINGVDQYINFVKLSATNGKNSMSTSPRTLDELCLPLFLIAEQLREDYDDEGEEQQHTEKWLHDDDIERIYENVAETVIWLQDLRGGGRKKKKQPSLDFVDMKKLSSSFKGLVGTKVANKWKRNRCEL